MPNVWFQSNETLLKCHFAIIPSASKESLFKALVNFLKLGDAETIHYHDHKGAFIKDLDISNFKDEDLLYVTVPKVPYRGMTPIEKREAIRGKKFNGVEITMPPAEIRECMEVFRLVTDKTKLTTQYPATASLTAISEKWDIDMDQFPPIPRGYGGKTFRPAGDASAWDLWLLVSLAILSDFTLGQGEYIATLVNSAVEVRGLDKRMKKNRHMVTSTDVVRVIHDTLHPLELEEGVDQVFAEGATD